MLRTINVQQRLICTFSIYIKHIKAHVILKVIKPKNYMCFSYKLYLSHLYLYYLSTAPSRSDSMIPSAVMPPTILPNMIPTNGTITTSLSDRITLHQNLHYLVVTTKYFHKKSSAKV